jgi:hypothetical protein
VLVLAIVATLIVLVVANPFASTPSSNGGFSDNAYPTGKAAVTQRTLSSQTEVSATLGYAGSFTVAVPNGTSATTITQARSMVQAAQAQVTSARTALANAAASARPTNASTLAAARNLVSSDNAALVAARTQLAADENLGCPASSSATVTSPVGSASSSSGANAAPPSASSNVRASESRSARSSPIDPGTQSATLSPHDAGAPQVTTGPVDATTSTTTRLTGTVNPNGAATTYYFEYGTSPNFGSTTLATGAGAALQLAVDADRVYFFGPDGLAAVPTGGGAVTTLAPGSTPAGIAVDATDVYWTDADAGTVMKVAK